MDNKKADIVLYCKDYFRFVAFLMILFICMFISFIYQYIINRNPIGFAFFLLIMFMMIFGGSALFLYSQLGSKSLIYDHTLVVRQWYGLKKTFDVKDIKKVFIKKSHGDITSIQIITDKENEKYFNNYENLDKFYDYLIHNVDDNRIS